jgi:hypothetical protein
LKGLSAKRGSGGLGAVVAGADGDAGGAVVPDEGEEADRGEEGGALSGAGGDVAAWFVGGAGGVGGAGPRVVGEVEGATGGVR